LLGFLYDGSTFTTIADPLGVDGTVAQGINDSGQIVGYYYDANHLLHGFIDNGGVFTTVDDPLGVNGTSLNGINDAGQVVGTYIDASNVSHGFVADQTTTLADPTVGASALLEIDGANSQTITFAGSSGTLVLDNPRGFTGEIAGISGTGNVLDFRGFSAATTTATTVGGYDGTTFTTLTVHDSSDNVTETFKLVGNYSASTWTVSSDGHGGANIVDPPAPTSQALGGVMAHDPGSQAVGGVMAHDPGGQALGGVMANDPGPLPGKGIVASAPNQPPTAGDNFAFNLAALERHAGPDYHPATDPLQFAGSFFAGTQAALTPTHDDGHGNTVVTFDGQDSITLGGVLKAQLHVGDFHV
jgi:hypothetical protein